MKRLVFPAGLILLICIVFAPLFLHPTFLLYPRGSQITDLTITHWPAVAFNVRSLRQDGQVPLWRTSIASGGPWAANPQSWLFYPPAWLFFLLPIDLTFNLLLLAHLILAALATYTFGHKALGMGPAGAVLAGLAFSLTPWLSAQLAAGHVNVALAIAWLPVALWGAHRAATTGETGGALLTGIAWAAALLNHAQMAAFTVALSLAWFVLVALTTATPVRYGRRVAQLLLMAAVGLLLSAALLIPLAEALPYLNRTALTADQAGVFSLSWSQLLAALTPTYGGEPEQAIYLGLPVVLLAVASLVLRRDRATWFFTATAAVAALFALGSHGPLFPLLSRLLPGLSWLRVPPRAWILVAFSLALLAGRGLDALSGMRLAASARRPATQTGLVALTFIALILIAADLGLVHTAWIEMRSPAEAFAWRADVAQTLARQPGPFRVYSPSYSIPQHVAMQYGLSLADGVDPTQLTSYANFLALAGGYEATGYSPTLPPRLDDSSAQPDAARLGLLNVAYVAADWPIEAEGLVWQTKIGETDIYHNEKVLPRAFVVAQPQTSGDASLERPIEATPAQIAVYTPNRIVVEAELAEPGLLVLSEVWYPGWRALADGVEVPIQRVEGVLRGVFLNAGRHTVEFRYSPWTVWAGLAVASGTALLLLAYGAIRLRRRS